MPFVPETDPGPFLSGLRWAGSVGQIPLQLLRGRPGAAGRKLVDVLGDIPDALLPGDWIPHVGDEDQSVRPSELVGIDPEAHPGIAKAADIVGGAALNPLSYTGLRGGTIKAGLPLTEGTAIPGATGLIDRAKGILGDTYERLPDNLQKMGAKTGAAIRRTANWLDVPDEYSAMADRAKGAGYQQSQVATERARQIYESATPDELAAVGDIVHRVNRGGGTDRSAWSVIDDPEQYIANLPPTMDKARVAEMVKQRGALMDSLAQDPTHGLQDAARYAGEDGQGYGMRRFSGSYFDDLPAPDFTPKTASKPNALKAREESVKTPGRLLDFMRENPDVELDFDPRSFDTRRAEQSGRIAEKAKLGEQLIQAPIEKLKARLAASDDPIEHRAIRAELNKISAAGEAGGFRLNDPEHVQAVRGAIQDLADSGQSDAAYKLKNMFDGVAPRGEDAFSQALVKGNRLFKSAATFGVALPRLAFNVGNRASGLWQVLSNEQARGTIGASTRRALGDLWGSVDDGLMRLFPSKGRWAKDELSQSLDAIDQANTAAQGDVRKFRELLGASPNGPMLQEALDSGVLNGFVNSEQLISRMAKTPRAQRVADFMEWPADIAQGVEQRMRLGTFMDLRKRGVETPAASKTVKDTYLDYDVPGVANRRLRDAVPFSAYLTQNLKQQAGLITRHPVVATAAAPLFGQDDGLPKYPWLDSQMAVPVGLDEKGDPQYISSFRMPIEGLTAVPGFNKNDAYKDVVGSLQPLLKTGISWLANKDPFSGNDFGSYGKVLGMEGGAAGRAFNVAQNTGLFQPITGPLGQLNNVIDDRKSLGERALQATTGLRFTSVDPDQARRQRIEQYLESDPDAKTYTGYYAEGDNPGLSDLLKQLSESKRRLSEKRKSAASVL